MENDVQFREMAYSMPPDRLKLLRNFANGSNMTRAVDMCLLYYPKLSFAGAEKFMIWLKAQHNL